MQFQEALDLVNYHNGISFGSRAWGGARKDSDHDYFMVLEDFIKVKSTIQSNGIEITESPYYVCGFFAKFPGCRVLNVTGVKKTDFKAWCVATRMMYSCDNHMDKSYRQMLFETSLAILKKAC
jgi:hypothetical protein